MDPSGFLEGNLWNPQPCLKRSWREPVLAQARFRREKGSVGRGKERSHPCCSLWTSLSNHLPEAQSVENKISFIIADGEYDLERELQSGSDFSSSDPFRFPIRGQV